MKCARCSCDLPDGSAKGHYTIMLSVSRPHIDSKEVRYDFCYYCYCTNFQGTTLDQKYCDDYLIKGFYR